MENSSFSFEDASFALQHSWEVHRQAFGPILEPAFTETPQVRILVINALNHISRREIQRGMELLKELAPYCTYEEDKAAWSFFVGLCFEMGGAAEQTRQWYERAAEYHHRFYLPYLKLAKAYHTKGQFDKAKHHYETAIACLQEMPEQDMDEITLASAYTNLTACLTMLHQYHTAESAWAQAQKYPLRPGACATAAILYAAMGNTAQTDRYLAALKQECPESFPQTQTLTQQILDGSHPHFPKGPNI